MNDPFDFEVVEYVALRWSGGIYELHPGARVWSRDALFPRLMREHPDSVKPIRRMIITVGPPELAPAA